MIYHKTEILLGHGTVGISTHNAKVNDQPAVALAFTQLTKQHQINDKPKEEDCHRNQAAILVDNLESLKVLEDAVANAKGKLIKLLDPQQEEDKTPVQAGSHMTKLIAIGFNLTGMDKGELDYSIAGYRVDQLTTKQKQEVIGLLQRLEKEMKDSISEEQ